MLTNRVQLTAEVIWVWFEEIISRSPWTLNCYHILSLHQCCLFFIVMVWEAFNLSEVFLCNANTLRESYLLFSLYRRRKRFQNKIWAIQVLLIKRRHISKKIKWVLSQQVLGEPKKSFASPCFSVKQFSPSILIFVVRF